LREKIANKGFLKYAKQSHFSSDRQMWSAGPQTRRYPVGLRTYRAQFLIFFENRKQSHFCTFFPSLRGGPNSYLDRRGNLRATFSVIPFSFSVIPAQAGIHGNKFMVYYLTFIDYRLRGNDEFLFSKVFQKSETKPFWSVPGGVRQSR